MESTNQYRLTEEFVGDIAGFCGELVYSANNKFCISFNDGYIENEKWEDGILALISGNILLYKKRIERPNDCHVSNGGIVVCCDWLNTDETNGNFLIFDTCGEIIFSRKTTANLSSSAISDDSKMAIFMTCNSETEDSDKIFIVDIEQKKITHEFQYQPYFSRSFSKAEINTKRKIIRLSDHEEAEIEIDLQKNIIIGAESDEDEE